MQNHTAPLDQPAGTTRSHTDFIERTYFTAVSSILVILSLVAFSDNLVTDRGQPSNGDPKFVVHGILWLTWFSLFVVQSRLIRRGGRTLHRKLGMITLAVGVGVILSTGYIFAVTHTGWQEMFVFARANRFLMVGFAVLLTLAFLHRTRPARHKRFILMANLYVLEPILDRVAGHLELNNAVFVLLAWNALFASAFLYDWATLGRAHPITATAFGVFCLAWAAAGLL